MDKDGQLIGHIGSADLKVSIVIGINLAQGLGYDSHLMEKLRQSVAEFKGRGEGARLALIPQMKVVALPPTATFGDVVNTLVTVSLPFSLTLKVENAPSVHYILSLTPLWVSSAGWTLRR